MGMKFLNKKGWHTGSLRNIENVWKAEQKHEAEQRKLEELRKQIHEERERAEFRQLQEQAGLIPRQERLEFLYESGLAVGKGSGSSFKELDSLPKTAPPPEANAASSVAAEKPQATPGALFEDTKPQSANDAWRKLHSDPLLLIRQREQEALARVKNNPVQMAMIRKSVELKKEKKAKKHSSKKHGKKSKHRKHSSSENESDSEGIAVEKQKESRQRGSRSEIHSHKEMHTSDEEPHEGDTRRKKYNDKESIDRRLKHEEQYGEQQTKRRHYDAKGREYYSERHVGSRNGKYEESNDDQMSRSRYDSKHREQSPEKQSESRNNKYKEIDDDRMRRKSRYDTKSREYCSERHVESRSNKPEESDGDRMKRNGRYEMKSREHSSERPLDSRNDLPNHVSSSDKPPRSGPSNKPRNPVKLSDEERAAKLREMQMDAEKHEEQRWKRLKKAEDTDAQEAVRDKASLGRNFLHAAQKSVYGAEKGGSSTIEESVRRRTHYLQQGRSATDSNAFRR